jgi:phosphoesterase RecJ-like protein
LTALEIYQSLLEFEHFLILGHECPDGDCLGSQLALASFLKRLDRSVKIYSAGPFFKPEIHNWESLFNRKLPMVEDIPPKSLMILLDCSTLDRTGLPIEEITLPLMIIDHHSSGSLQGEYSMVDAQSPSTTLLIQQIIEASGKKPNSEEANYIFFGFCTDTAFFKHLAENNLQALRSIARLAESGINPNSTYSRINGGKDLASQKLVARIIGRSNLYFFGKLIYSWEELKDHDELNLTIRDAGTVYQMLQSIQHCEIILLLKEMKDNQVSVSFRSSGDLDVGEIAHSLGGGGHAKASGCTLDGSIMEVRDLLLELFERYF